MARTGWYVAGAAVGAALVPAGLVLMVLWLLGYLAPPAFVPRDNTRFEQVTMVTAGGIAGGSRGVALHPDGSYLLFTGSGDPALETGHGRIGGDRLTEIRDLATSSQLTAEARRPGLRGTNTCMDGITTTITMAHFRMSVYDCATHPDVPTFRTLTNRLATLR